MPSATFQPRLALGFVAFITATAVATAADFRIEAGVIATSPREYYLTQSRGALIPGNPSRVIITTQETEKTGAHGYRDLFSLESTDAGRTWTPPVRIDHLRRAPPLLNHPHG